MAAPKILELIARFANRVRSKGQGDAARALQRLGAKDSARAIEVLEQIAGQTSGTSRKALRTAATQGVLPGPPPALVRKLAGARVGAGYRQPLATALLRGVRQGVGQVVAAVRKAKAARFDPLFGRLGNLSEDQWAAMLQKAIMWAPHTGDRLAGQVATLTGLLLERLRRSSAAFLAGGGEAASIVAEHNAGLLGKGLKGTAAEVEALVAKEAAAGNRKVFRGTDFFENMTDGDDKLLTDGMHLSFNADGEVLVPRIEEVKLASVGRDALPQIDEDLVRLRTRGLKLADGRYFPPERIRFPKRGPALSAYIEGAPGGGARTPRGHAVTVHGVRADHLRELARDLLVEWRKRLPQLAGR
jgi:hypothetical protein